MNAAKSDNPARHWDDTFLGSNRLLARTFARPLARFLHVEAAAGILLLVGALVAVIWANSPWSESYFHLLETEAGISWGDWHFELTIHEWVNDALMTLFFFVVGMEIKREFVVGELRDTKTAAAPVIGALGGMVVPAAIYFAINAGTDASHGWGIPMATDIAFAVGIVSLLGSRVPVQLKLFLLTLAVADDLGAIAVIAIFYSSGIDFAWLGVAVAVLVGTYIMRRARVWYIPAYVAVGTFAWFAVLQSGVHATVAGVVLGFITPMVPLNPTVDPESVADTLENRAELTVPEVRAAAFKIQETVPVAERLIDFIHPWTAYVVIPIFALANAGIVLGGDIIAESVTSRVGIGIFLGLVAGKTLGVTAFAWASQKLGIGRLPRGTSVLQLLGISAAAGIGFTVAIFVTELAFSGVHAEVFKEEAKIGIFAASFVASVMAATMLTVAGRRLKPGDRELQERESEVFFGQETARVRD